MKQKRFFFLMLILALIAGACNIPGYTEAPLPVVPDEETPTTPSEELVNELPPIPTNSPSEPVINSSVEESSTPDSFTLPAGQSIPVYDGPGGESSGTFQVELFWFSDELWGSM